MADRPAIPVRNASSLPSRVTFQGPQTWRESIVAFVTILMAFIVMISVICLGFYVYRDKALYEELVDYLDKTISISKINYNAFLGLYQLSQKELDVLSQQRTYKTIIWCFLASELGCYVFISLVLILYFGTRVETKKIKIFFWAVVILGAIYCVVEIHLFTFAVLPYTALLPNTTEQLFNHAIPHNPGGLQQMELRFGCTFDHNLYAANKRRLNPRNTCDPHIENSFLPRVLLWFLLGLRLVPIVLGVLLLAKRTPFSEMIAQGIEKLKNQQKQRLYVKKQQTTSHNSNAYTPDKKGTTTFGVTPSRSSGTPLPPIPSPSIDHTISYNNAAFFATSGGINSSRSSEISRSDAHDLFRPMSHHASGSLQSEV